MGRAVGTSRREKNELKVFERISKIFKARHGNDYWNQGRCADLLTGYWFKSWMRSSSIGN